MRVRSGVLFRPPVAYKGTASPCKRKPLVNKKQMLLSTPDILLMTTKKIIRKRATVPLMKKTKVNSTTFACSTVDSLNHSYVFWERFESITMISQQISLCWNVDRRRFRKNRQDSR